MDSIYSRNPSKQGLGSPTSNTKIKSAWSPGSRSRSLPQIQRKVIHNQRSGKKLEPLTELHHRPEVEQISSVYQKDFLPSPVQKYLTELDTRTELTPMPNKSGIDSQQYNKLLIKASSSCHSTIGSSNSARLQFKLPQATYKRQFNR